LLLLERIQVLLALRVGEPVASQAHWLRSISHGMVKLVRPRA
jgi:hypothetical protein